MKQNDFYEILPNYIKQTKDLTLGSKNVLAALLFLNNNEYSKENGFFYRSNKDLCKDSMVSEPTLIKSLSQLEMLGFIQRKIGDRKSGASEYKLNENFTQSLKVNFSNNFSNQKRVKIQGFSNNFSNNTKNETLVIQNPNKQRDLEENFSKDFSNNFSTDTEVDTDIDKDIIYNLNNNIIELNKNLKEIINLIKNNIIPEPENNIIPEPEEKEKKYIQKEKEINETQTPLDGFASKKEEKQTPTIENEKPVEKEILNNINVETTVIENNNKKPSVEMEIISPANETAVQYKFMHYEEQLEKYNILIEKLKKCTSAEELTHKHTLMQKYMREHSFLISFSDNARNIYKELLKNFETPTHSNILVTPTDFNALEERENAAVQTEAKLSHVSPSNDDGGIVAHQEDNDATGAKKTALEAKREERLKNLNELIDTIETLSDFKFVQQRVNASWDVLTTEDIAELAEKLTYKAISL